MKIINCTKPLEDEAWFCEPEDLPEDSATGQLACVNDGITNHAHIQVETSCVAT